MPLSLICLGAALAARVYLPAAPNAPRPIPHRWFYLSTNLLVDANVSAAVGVMRRAAACGYNGFVLADYKLNILDRMGPEYFNNARRIADTAKALKLELVPAVFPIGYSSGILAHDPNLVEGIPVVDAPFRVRNGKAFLEPDPAIGVRNGGFEEANGATALGWQFQDFPGKASFIDREVRHSGGASLRFQNVGTVDPQYGHGRIMQQVTLKPHRYYRLTAWMKTADFQTPGEVRILMLAGKRNLCEQNLGVRSTQDWREHQVTFNSLDSSQANLYIGVWGGKGGTLWIDDVRLEELGLVNVIRREGCPLKVRAEDGTQYIEGRDFEPVRDPKMGNVPWPGEFELYHEASPIVLSPQSRIREGQRLLVSFYHPAFIYDMQTTCCLTHPKVYQVLMDQMRRVEALFHPTAVLMSHDEIRIANWCAACQARRMTPGQMLADNVRRCVAIIRSVSPRARIYVWSDMFDPSHNAHDDYYLVNGTWSGSWEGLSPDVGIVNWNFDGRKKSLPFFANRGNKQILAGYYDRDAGTIAKWLDDAKNVPGIDGVMYTTWLQRYEDLEAFARAAWGAK
ncbi:MAG: hypothetical protein ACP5VE_00900 [Chthonomonadales bacterium]